MENKELGRIRKNSYNLRGFKRAFVFILVAAVLVATGSVLAWQQVTRRLSQDARESIASAGRELAENFNYLLEAEFQILSSISVSLETPAVLNYKERLVSYLERQNNRNLFDSTGYQAPDGTAWFSNGEQLNWFLSPQEVKTVYEQKRYVSGRRTDPFDNDDILVFAVPLKEGQETGVVFATHSASFYRQTLTANLWQGNGIGIIMDKSGDIVLSAPKSSFGNIFDMAEGFVFDGGFSAAKIKADIASGGNGLSGYSFNGEHRFASYYPLKFNQWYAFAVLPTAFVAQKALGLMVMAWLICFSVIAVLVVFIVFILRMQHQNGRALYQMGFVDALTQADNLNAFHFKYTSAVESFKQKGVPFALVVVNINRFKAVNDIYGFEEGDKILKQVALALQEGLQEGELFCRSSADEFLLLLACPGRTDLALRLENVAQRAGRFCQADGKCMPLSLTCGVYVVDEDVPFYIMVDRAKLALSSARQRAGAVYAFYDEEFRRRIVAEKNIESHMEAALQTEEFKIYLQPKCNFETGRVESAEALVRWEQPGKGLIAPDHFIPIFEKNGFILKLDWFMFKQTLSLLKQWKEAGLEVVPVGINFSRLHLDDSHFVEELSRLADEYGVEHRLLEAELTESVVFGNTDVMKRFVDDLHAKGFSVAMDDFGSGYSSLNVLKNLDFDCIKLDKEFLMREESSGRMRVIISGLVSMIKGLNSRIVAEGVETPEQAQFLQSIGCDLAQGYLFYKPLSPQEFAKLLRPVKKNKRK